MDGTLKLSSRAGVSKQKSLNKKMTLERERKECNFFGAKNGEEGKHTLVMAQAFSYKLYKQRPAGKFKAKWGWLTWLQKLIPQEKLGSPQPKIHLKDWNKCGFCSDRTP